MQFVICTLCGWVFAQQSGLTRHCFLTHAGDDPNSSNLSTSDGLDYELADHILQFQDDILSQPPDTKMCANGGAPIDDTVRVHSLDDDEWDPLPLFATPQ
jgi:hypothetical protein